MSVLQNKCVSLMTLWSLVVPFFLIILGSFVIVVAKMKKHAKKYTILLSLSSFFFLITMFILMYIYMNQTSDNQYFFNHRWIVIVRFGILGCILAILSILLMATTSVLQSISRLDFILECIFVGIFLMSYVTAYIKNIRDSRMKTTIQLDGFQLFLIAMEILSLLGLLILHVYINRTTNNTHADKNTFQSFRYYELSVSLLTIVLSICLILRITEHDSFYRSKQWWMKVLPILLCVSLIIVELFEKHTLLPIVIISLMIFCMIINMDILSKLSPSSDTVFSQEQEQKQEQKQASKSKSKQVQKSRRNEYYFICGKKRSSQNKSVKRRESQLGLLPVKNQVVV